VYNDCFRNDGLVKHDKTCCLAEWFFVRLGDFGREIAPERVLFDDDTAVGRRKGLRLHQNRLDSELAAEHLNIVDFNVVKRVCVDADGVFRVRHGIIR